MKTSKTVLAAAAFGVVASISAAGADEVKYNFSSEFERSESAVADGRTEGTRQATLVQTGDGSNTAQRRDNAYHSYSRNLEYLRWKWRRSRGY